MSEYLEFAKRIAYLAGDIMLKYFNSKMEANYKFDDTIVTNADLEINEMLIDEVKKNFPDHAVDGEENGYGGSEYVWVCDPVDGTAMFARNIPVSVFSLALVHNGESIIGVIYDPFNKDLYYASKGSGAYLNDQLIHVNDILLDDKRSVSNVDMWPNAPYQLSEVVKILGSKTYFVSIGSVIHAGALVARGNFNLAIFPGTTHKNCDIAALAIIVKEAGGKVTDLFGNEQRYDKSINGAVISNGIVHDEVVDLLNERCEKL